MSVLSRIQSLNSELGRLQAAKEGKALRDHLDEVRRRLSSSRQPLQRATQSAQLLVARGVLDKNAVPDAGDAVKKLEALRKKFDEDRSAITKARAFPSTEKSLEQLAGDVSEECQRAWRELVDAVPRVDLSVLALYEKAHPDKRRDFEQLRHALTNMGESRNRVPVSQQDWEQFQTLRQTIERKKADLPTETIPEEVRKFLQQAQDYGGARLTLMTDEIREWLEEHDMLGNLRIRFG